MKTPRITDFDPDAKLPTLKSSLDNMPSIQKPKTTTTPEQTISSIVTNHEQPPATRSIKKPPALKSPKRSFVRRTFDFYDDQITYLTRLSLQERLAGKERSMNEMVREALDDWIKKNVSAK
jgi:hypothetical protein